MKNLLRLLGIFLTLARYRLDLLLDTQKIPKKYIPLLFIFKLFKKPKEPRGKRLRLALEELGPIFIKFGQILSTRPDLFPADIIKELSLLQDRVKPFDNTTFKKIVEQSLENSTEELFLEFSETPLASASIAQVHSAKLKNGQDIVVKVVRPNIEKTIARDISLLHFIATIIEKFLPSSRRLKPIEIVEDYKNTILDELDLAKEAANASQLRRNFVHSDKLYIPEVYWDYCRENVMVMERIYGIPVNDAKALEKQNTDMKELAERGVEIFFTQVFDHNFFHADMHPGNVFVSRENPKKPQYIAVDMAIVGSLTKEDQYYLARNLIAMFRRDYRQVAELHVSSGWVPKETSVGAFESSIRAVCEPIFEKPLKDISFGQALITLFKTAQRFDMPVQPQLVLLQKTLVNIEGLGRQIYPDLDLWDTAHPFLERWLKRRYHPKNVIKELQYHVPEWLERLPDIPQVVLQTLEAQHDISRNISDLNKKLDKQSYKPKRAQSKWVLLSSGLFITALVNYFFIHRSGFVQPEHFIVISALLLILSLSR